MVIVMRRLWMFATVIIAVVAVALFIVAEQPHDPASGNGVPPMLLGVHENYQGPNATNVQETLNTFPKTKITREFIAGIIPPQNLVPKFKRLCDPIWNIDAVPNVSFKLSPADVRSGEWRPFIEQLAAWLRDNNYAQRTIITIWHEPEDDVADSFPNGAKKTTYFKTAEEFVAYFNTINGWLKNVSSLITTSHAALGYGYRPKVGGPRDKSAYVTRPDAWVTDADINAIDIYSGRSFPLDMTLNTSDAFGRWLNSRPQGRPWGVAERGWIAAPEDSEARVHSIAEEMEWLSGLPLNARPSFYIVWNTEGTENDPKIILDAAGESAINDMFDELLTPPEEPQPTPEPQPSTIECPTCHGSGRVPSDQTYSVTVTTHAK